MTFDEQVASLRGKVEPRQWSRLKKSDATPEQWAAKADYLEAWRKANAEGVRARACEAQSRYKETAKGREAVARYKASAKCSAKQLRYRSSEKARETDRRWRRSEGGRSSARLAQARYQRTDEGRAAARRHRGKRLASDVQFRISVLLRGRFTAAIRNNSRRGSAVRDLGCSVADLKANIERQFTDGMGWHNWGTGPGTWQIDHVYPLARADLTDRLHVLAVCNWRNLQPLWFEDNVRKGDKVTPEAQQLFDGLIREFQQEVFDGEVA